MLTQLLEMQTLNQGLATTTMETMVLYHREIVQSHDYETEALEHPLSHFQSVAHILSLYTILQQQTRHSAVDGLIAWAIGYGAALQHENLTKIATVLASMRR